MASLPHLLPFQADVHKNHKIEIVFPKEPCGSHLLAVPDRIWALLWPPICGAFRPTLLEGIEFKPSREIFLPLHNRFLERKMENLPPLETLFFYREPFHLLPCPSSLPLLPCLIFPLFQSSFISIPFSRGFFPPTFSNSSQLYVLRKEDRLQCLAKKACQRQECLTEETGAVKGSMGRHWISRPQAHTKKTLKMERSRL